jgi:hypothetical protein
VVLSGNAAEVQSQTQIFTQEVNLAEPETTSTPIVSKSGFIFGNCIAIITGITGGSIVVPLRLATNKKKKKFFFTIFF